MNVLSSPACSRQAGTSAAVRAPSTNPTENPHECPQLFPCRNPRPKVAGLPLAAVSGAGITTPSTECSVSVTGIATSFGSSQAAERMAAATTANLGLMRADITKKYRAPVRGAPCLILWRARPRALASLGDIAIVTAALARGIDQRQHRLDQSVCSYAKCEKGDCSEKGFDTNSKFISKHRPRRESCADCADERDQERGADRESTRRCGGPASRGVGIHGCVRHPISTCVD